MKLNKILIIGILILLLIIIKTSVLAFSIPLRQFINNDKQLRLLLYEGKKELSFIPGENLEVKSLDGTIYSKLNKNRKYNVRFKNKKKAYWKIQVFATLKEDKALDIKDKLSKAGYQNIMITQKNSYFKVKIGNFLSKAKARPVIEGLEKDGWNTWLVQSELQEFDKSSSVLGVYTPKGELLISGQGLEIKGSVKINNSFYPGEFYLLASNKGIKVFNKVKLKYLLYGMLETKFKNYYPKEFLQVMVVIDRSFILSRLFKDTGYLKIPIYQGVTQSDKIIIEAVNSTEGQVLKNKRFSGSGSDKNKQFISNNIYRVTEIFTGYLNIFEQNVKYNDILEQYYPDGKLVDLTKIIEQEVKVEATVKWGLEYKEIRQLTWWGPRVITILDLDRERAGFLVEPVLAGNKIFGREDLAIIVKKNEFLGGINGGFFSYTGRPLGLFVKNSKIISEPIKDRTAFVITRKGKMILDRINWYGQLAGEDQIVKVTGVNRRSSRKEVIIFNNYFGDRVPQLEKNMKELIIRNNRIQMINNGQEINSNKKINKDKNKKKVGSYIPEDGFIIQAYGDACQDLAGFEIGDKIKYTDKFELKREGKNIESGDIVSALGAGPTLLTGGKINITGKEEKFQSDILQGRAPRTAVGVTHDNHLVLVTVDGRQPELSIGITLRQLALFMQDYGIVKAMNFDGGGSARMVVRGYTMSNPSKKRLISNGLVIKFKGY